MSAQSIAWSLFQPDEWPSSPDPRLCLFGAGLPRMSARILLHADSADAMLLALLSARTLVVRDGLGVGDADFLYGWLDDEFDGWAGRSTWPGPVGFGVTDPARWQRVFAHETGHMLGLGHTSLLVDEPDWTAYGHLHAFEEANGVDVRRHDWQSGRNRERFVDVMAPGALTKDTWIHPDTLRLLSSVLSIRRLMAFARHRDGDGARGGVAVILGAIDGSRPATTRLCPVFRPPWPMQPTLFPGGGNVRLELRDDRGEVHTWPCRLTLRGGAGSAAGYGPPAVFELVAPVPYGRGLLTVRLVEEETGAELASLSAAGDITLHLDHAELHRHATGEVRLRWGTSGIHVDGAAMVHVAASPDGGRNWYPFAAGLPAATGECVLPAAGSAEWAAAMVRVFLIDRLQTSWTDLHDVDLS